MRLFGYSEIFLNKDFSVEDVQRIRLERVVRHVLVQMLYIGIDLPPSSVPVITDKARG